MTAINSRIGVAVGAVLLLAGLPAAAEMTANRGTSEREWHFRVFLDDDPIGFHRFRLTPEEEGYRLQTEAEFQVKFLFLTAYRYEHQNEEAWRDGCLVRMESQTNDNGDRYRVVGTREAGEFQLDLTAGSEQLDADCVRSFAYWDLEALQASRLLNAQTGEYLPVDLERIGRESIEINGSRIEAERYSLDAEGLDLELWYSPEGEWLRLTSNVENGRQLRYELDRS